MVQLLEFLRPSFGPTRRGAPYSHIGALLADAALQAGVSYQYVVQPRVTRILRRYPSGSTVRKLTILVRRISAGRLLSWSDTRKQQLFIDLLGACASNEIDSVEDLSRWLDEPGARLALLSIHGVGNKSFDYLRLLCGHAVFPVDRHMRYLLHLAGVGACVREYRDAQQLLMDACGSLGLDPRNTEAALWCLLRSC